MQLFFNESDHRSIFVLLYLQAGKTQDTTNSDTSEKVSNGVVAKEINNGDNRPEKENKEQREKRNASNPTHQ